MSDLRPPRRRRLTLTENEALALLELLEDKGLTEYRSATPDLERVFDKLEALKSRSERESIAIEAN